MPNRDGSSSSFPGSLDQFVSKKKYNPDLPLSQQEFNSLEQASHFNHMFDALFKIESHLLAGSGGAGGLIVSRWSNGVSGSASDVYGSNLKVAYSTLSIVLTGNTITATGLVPSSFGVNPFDHRGFSVAHNLYITNPAGSANTQGIWANESWGDQGPYNEAIKWFQFFTLIRPVTGRLYEATIKNIPFHSTSESITSSFTDLLTCTSAAQAVWDRIGWTGTGGLAGISAHQTINGNTYLIMSSEGGGHLTSPPGNSNGNDSAYGWVWPTKFPNLTDSYVEWGEIVDRYSTPETGDECYSRLGPMIRASGTLSNASFYGIAIGDVPISANGLTGDGGRYGRIIKVVGANLGSVEGAGGESGGGTLWGSIPTISYIGTGTAYTTSSSGYYWFGEAGTRYRLKCETVPGSAKITVQSATSPYSSWSDLYGPFYDGQSPLTSGYSGFFSQAMDGDSNRWVKFLGEVKVENLNSNTSIDAELQLLFLLVNPESNLTMESGA